MQLSTIWHTHAGKVVTVLDAVDAHALSLAATARGRTVGAHLAHLQGVRVEWLRSALKGADDIPSKVGREQAGDAEAIREGLLLTADAIGALLAKDEQEGGKVRGFGGGAGAFLAYLLAHEWYHLGKVTMILDLNGAGLGDKLAYGLWEGWGR